MSKPAVLCTVPSRNQADRIIDELKANHFFTEDISVLFSDRPTSRKLTAKTASHLREDDPITPHEDGLHGLVSGTGAITIPGVGPFLAAGPIVDALIVFGVGAAPSDGASSGAEFASSIAKALIRMGIEESEARRYEVRVERGDILVAVRTSDAEEACMARDIFIQDGAEEIWGIGDPLFLASDGIDETFNEMDAAERLLLDRNRNRRDCETD